MCRLRQVSFQQEKSFETWSVFMFCWDAFGLLLHSKNDFLHNVRFDLNASWYCCKQLSFSPAAINYRQCHCYRWLFIAGVVVTGNKLKVRISPRIYVKIRNVLNGILRGSGEIDSWKNLKSKISCETSFKCEMSWYVKIKTLFTTLLPPPTCGRHYRTDK
jgi:hypothetical protein